jgi:D-alanyl-D-alanine carboxypeptidase (penicillin-binding protein 5/6)
MRFYQLVFALTLSLLTQLAWSGTPVPAPPGFKSSSLILMDYATGNIILEKNPDEPLEPASLTKIMTAYLTFKEIKAGRLSMDDEVLVSEKAWKTGGSRMFIEVGKMVKIDDLLHGLVIQSGNDAAVALAEHIAGTEDAFATLMNQQAKALGMKHTHFVNATGWPAEGHTTTARDLALLTKAMIRDFPKLYKLNAIKEFTFNEIKQHNRNKLLWRDKSVDGVKTGHTEAAGYCLVASAIRDDMRLISVVLGTDSEKARADASSKLLNYGFRFYETRKLYSSGDELTQTRVWKAEKPSIRLGISNDVVVTIPRGDYKLMNAELEFNEKIVAPITKGTKVGKVVISLEGKTITTRPLVALESVNEGSIWTKLMDSMRLMAE